MKILCGSGIEGGGGGGSLKLFLSGFKWYKCSFFLPFKKEMKRNNIKNCIREYIRRI